jgi:hypothetical protein
MRASLRSAEGKGIKPREIGGGSLVKSSSFVFRGRCLYFSDPIFWLIYRLGIHSALRSLADKIQHHDKQN